MTPREKRIAELIDGLTDDQFVQLRLELGSLLETYIPADFWRGLAPIDVLQERRATALVLAPN